VVGWVVGVSVAGRWWSSSASPGANTPPSDALAPGVGRTAAARRAVVAVVAVFVVVGSGVTGWTRVQGLARDRAAVQYQHRVHADLNRVVTAAGGRDALLACGRPVVGPRRGPMVAWRLRLRKEQVGFRVGAGAVVLQSALQWGAETVPVTNTFAVIARAGVWTARGAC
jgi:hypothetical protein